MFVWFPSTASPKKGTPRRKTRPTCLSYTCLKKGLGSPPTKCNGDVHVQFLHAFCSIRLMLERCRRVSLEELRENYDAELAACPKGRVGYSRASPDKDRDLFFENGLDLACSCFGHCMSRQWSYSTALGQVNKNNEPKDSRTLNTVMSPELSDEARGREGEVKRTAEGWQMSQDKICTCGKQYDQESP